VLVGKERHTPYVRENDTGYPCRAIRTHRYLYIRNLKPNRWPEGDTFYGAGPSSARDMYINQCNDPAIQPYIRLAWAKRPAEELYDIQADVDCINNLAQDPDHKKVKDELWEQLNTSLKEQGDPRINGDDHYDNIEYFKGPFWKEQRPKAMKAVEELHKVMGKAGW